MGSREVVGICAHACAGNFAIDLCAACLGVFKFFEHENTCAFAHDETVAALAEGAAGALRIVVAGGESVHGVETAESSGSDGCFCTAGDDGAGFAETNEIEGIGNGVGRRGTSRSCSVVRTVESVHDGDLSGCDVGDHLGDEEGAEARSLLFVSEGVFADLLFEV